MEKFILIRQAVNQLTCFIGARSRLLLQRDQSLDYCSPGNVVRFKDEWILCLQSYPRPDYTADQKPRYGSHLIQDSIP